MTYPGPQQPAPYGEQPQPQPQPPYYPSPPIDYATGADQPPAPQPHRRRWVWLTSILVIVAAAAATLTVLLVNQNTPEKAAKQACIDSISAQLKSPSTAKFSDVQVQNLQQFTNVTGTVDAENSFGAMLRRSFTCSVGTDENGNTVVGSASLIGDGE